MTWRRNLFQLPTGKDLTKTIGHFTIHIIDSSRRGGPENDDYNACTVTTETLTEVQNQRKCGISRKETDMVAGWSTRLTCQRSSSNSEKIGESKVSAQHSEKMSVRLMLQGKFLQL